MQDITRIALAGLGVRGGHWRDAMDKSLSAELVAVVETRPEVGADVPVYPSIGDALAAEPDAVIVATPPEAHLEVVEPCLAAGIPVLCEKPLSESFEEAQSMVATARRCETPLLVGMNFRFVPSVQAMKELIASRAYGDPLFGEFTYIRNRDGRRKDLNDYPLTMDEPMLVDQSIHHLDLMRYVYGQEVVTVSALTWNPPTSVYVGNSCVATLLQFEDGLVVSYLGTWTSGTNRFDFRWRTDLADGALIQREQFGDLFAARRIPELGLEGRPFDTTCEPPQPLGVGPSKPFVNDTENLLSHFLEVVQGRATAGPTAADHVLTLNLVNSIHEAADTGTVVDVAGRAQGVIK
jgi:predicted dehydrogenase